MEKASVYETGESGGSSPSVGTNMNKTLNPNPIVIKTLKTYCFLIELALLDDQMTLSNLQEEVLEQIERMKSFIEEL